MQTCFPMRLLKHLWPMLVDVVSKSRKFELGGSLLMQTDPVMENPASGKVCKQQTCEVSILMPKFRSWTANLLMF